jgi:predicted GIY-YIG superfamily endonuclease
MSVQLFGTDLRSFTDPDTKRGLPKLYVIRSGSEVVYVGQTTQSIRTRLRQGLKAKGESGYYGYMWRDLDGVEILVWCFPNRDKEYVETVEGELVYLHRKRKGKWPERQMEIHFHNASADEVEAAEAIYRESLR